MQDADEGHVFTVSQISNTIKEILESSFSSFLIEGEISNCKFASAGHLYLTLKDANAQISCAMWKSAIPSLTFEPKDGMLVRCRARISVYPPHGKYQLILNRMEIAGEGNILQMLEKRKKEFAREGLFDEAHKKPLPFFPNTVGVVTSATGAALRDILQIARRRNPAVSLVVFPAIVQGNDAAPTIVQQIKVANDFSLCDVLIVGRGGGSLEDLLPFSDERVVRSIFNSRIPIISAVGHEIDWALSDYVADVRAPTPSAAAELALPLKSEIIRKLQNYTNEFYTIIKQKIENMKLVIKTFNPENLELKFRAIEQPLLMRFDNCKISLLNATNEKLKDAKQKIALLTQVLENANPQKIFARGYSMVLDSKTKKIIRNASEVSIDDEIEIVPARGKISARVLKIENEK